MRPSSRTRDGFSLVELLVVLAVISVLAALLFPVFLTVRGKARQTACASNLHQIGLGIGMYMQDYDGLYPRGVDPADRLDPAHFSRYPDFQADIPHLPWLQDLLKPYVPAPQVFACPADCGVDVADFSGAILNAFPTEYGKYGTSYSYTTTIAARRWGEQNLSVPAQTPVLFDCAGHWHGTLTPLELRYNTLFADAHVKNVTHSQWEEYYHATITE